MSGLPGSSPKGNEEMQKQVNRLLYEVGALWKRVRKTTEGSSNSDLSDLKLFDRTTDVSSTTETAINIINGSGWLLNGLVAGFNIHEVRLIVDGNTNVLEYGFSRYDAHDGGAIHHVALPPARFVESLKLEFDTGSSTTRVGAQAWVRSE